jgi:hypothetical protein
MRLGLTGITMAWRVNPDMAVGDSLIATSDPTRLDPIV